jgi:hypothetical protein
MEKYIIDEENSIKENMKGVKNWEFDQMTKKEVRGLLGVEGKCLLVEGLSGEDNYHSLK